MHFRRRSAGDGQLLCSIVIAAALTAILPSVSFAQDAQEPSQAIVEPTAAQLELNNQGVTAISERNFEQAVRLFKASLDLGELNITYVNMGRAYQYLNECDDAADAYERALRSPAIAEPSPEEIAEVVERYQNELAESCEQKASAEAETEAEEVAEESVEEVRSIQPPPSTPSEEPVDEESASMAPYFWLGGGGASVVGGVLLDTLPASASNGEFDALDVVPVGLYAVGAGALIYGIILLLD